MFLGWGAVVAWTGASRPADIDIAGAYLLGAGLGVVAGGLLPRLGFVVDTVGLGAGLAAGGLLLALTPRDARLDDAQTYAAFLAVVAVVNLALAAVAARGATRSARA